MGLGWTPREGEAQVCVALVSEQRGRLALALRGCRVMRWALVLGLAFGDRGFCFAGSTCLGWLACCTASW